MGRAGRSSTPTRSNSRSRAPSRRQRDRVLRAVPLSVGSPRLVLTGDLVDTHDRMPELIGVKDFWRQGVAAPMTNAAVCVDTDADHGMGAGNTNGSDSTDRSAAV